MKKLFFTIVFFNIFFSAFSQNGLKSGSHFLLLERNHKISINKIVNQQIKQIKTYSISDKNIYTTDQEKTVAIIDTSRLRITLFDFLSSKKTEIEIPFFIKPKTILPFRDNLFVGGEIGEEMLLQYQIKTENWCQLNIPNEIRFPGKAIDDLLVNDSFLIAIDNVVIPKFILFYKLNSKYGLEFSHSKELKPNGTYEHISGGRISKKYLGLISNTYSGYINGSKHLTIYQDLELISSFALSTNENDEDYHTFTDFLIVKDKVLIASKEKGFGVFKIKKSFFKNESDRFKKNSRDKVYKIKYEKFREDTVIDLTIVPNTKQIILTLQRKNGFIRLMIRTIN